MAAEKLFHELSFPGRIIPIPRQLSAGCGLAWRTEMEYREEAEETLGRGRIRWQEMAPVSLWV